MKKILKLNQMKSTRRKMLGYTGKQNLQRFESRNIFSVEKRMKIIKGWTSKSLKDKKIILPIKTKNLRGGGVWYLRHFQEKYSTDSNHSEKKSGDVMDTKKVHRMQKSAPSREEQSEREKPIKTDAQ